ncbi:hypothetical protein L2E82_43798 [Cichorium intybus]|uniref:Uncharacterized protein n=1 Tax=Cichorium intybus TaxID=13427 RepID=A0ACB8ZPH5_CICIN|nr:hypothetical protein L2E82_43798 [Cichorium intybus]
MKSLDPPLWKSKGLKLTSDSGKTYSIADFFHENVPKLEESVLGPGAGAGVGCGVGLGLGLVGGVGFRGSEWNQIARITFGFGIGCGVGLGFGFGQGFGFGSSWETLKSRVVKRNPGLKKGIEIQV